MKEADCKNNMQDDLIMVKCRMGANTQMFIACLLCILCLLSDLFAVLHYTKLIKTQGGRFRYLHFTDNKTEV
jgi:hypothetical protein